MRPRVYLSKSNKADIDSLLKVRKELSKLDVDVLEYNGGTEYSKSNVESSDYLLVLPYTDTIDYLKCNGTVGKGVYSEIRTFDNLDNTYILNAKGSYSVAHNLVEHYINDESDYKTQYGYIEFEYENCYLSKLFSAKKESILTDNTLLTDNRRLLLLLK